MLPAFTQASQQKDCKCLHCGCISNSEILFGEMSRHPVVLTTYHKGRGMLKGHVSHSGYMT